jgi:hypothetical protein
MLFKRMILDQWTDWLPAVSFALVFLVFLFAVVRALAGSRHRIDYLAALPFDGDEPEQGDSHV